MPGGKSCITGEDGKKFEQGNLAALKWTEDEALRLGNDLLDWIRDKGEENIFFNDFLYLEAYKNDYVGKIYPQLLSYLSKKYSSFLNILSECAEIEKAKLMKYGSKGTVIPAMAKFLLSAQYGLTEKTTTDLTTKGEKIESNLQSLTTEELMLRANAVSKLNDKA